MSPICCMCLLMPLKSSSPVRQTTPTSTHVGWECPLLTIISKTLNKSFVSKYNHNTLYTIKKNTPISVNTGFYPNNSLLWWYHSTVVPFISIHTILILIMILNDYYNHCDLHITPRNSGITMVPCAKKQKSWNIFCKYNTVYSMAITAFLFILVHS